MDFQKEMTGFFMHSVTLPDKVTTHFTGLVGRLVVLKRRSGGTWHVGLIGSGDKLVLQPGWSDFASANNVSQNDLLLFKFIGGCTFEVQIFDSRGLEKSKGSMEVVSKTKNSSTELENNRVEDSHVVEVNRIKFSCGFQIVAAEEERYNGSATSETMIPPIMSKHYALQKEEIKQNLFYQNEGEGEIKNKGCIPIEEMHCELHEFGYAIKIDPTNQPSENSRKRLVPGENSFYLSRYSKMSAEQKKRLHQLASEVQIGNPSFAKVLIKSSLSRSGINLSTNFCAEHLPKETRDVVLCLPNNEKTWSVKYYYRRGHQTFERLSWVKFVQENRLREWDICLFELVKAAKQITFIVHVSRAT